MGGYKNLIYVVMIYFVDESVGRIVKVFDE